MAAQIGRGSGKRGRENSCNSLLLLARRVMRSRSSLVRRRAPPDLRRHLQVYAFQYGSNYKLLHDVVMAYLHAIEKERPEEQSSAAAVPTDVLYLGQVMGKGKGRVACCNFARGVCTFGDKCKFEHGPVSVKSDDRSASSSPSSGGGCYVKQVVERRDAQNVGEEKKCPRWRKTRRHRISGC